MFQVVRARSGRVHGLSGHERWNTTAVRAFSECYPIGMSPEEPPHNGVGVLWASAAALMAGSFVIPWKLATPHGEEEDAVLVLLISAAVLNTLLVPATPRRGAQWSGDAIRLSVLLAVLTLAGNLASALSIERVSAPILSVLQRAEVLIAALVAWVLMGERPHAVFWAGAAVAGIGLVWMQGGEGTLDPWGVVYGLSSAVCFGSMLVAVRRYAADIDMVFVNAFRLWLSVGFWFLLHREIPSLEGFSPTFVVYVALAGMFGPFLSRLFSMQSSRFLEARFTALILLSVPALTVPLAWLFLGTVPAGRELEGGGLMLVGIALPVVWMLRGRVARAR